MLSRKLYKNLLYMQHSDSLRKASFDQRRIILFNGFILRIIKAQTVFIFHFCVLPRLCLMTWIFRRFFQRSSKSQNPQDLFIIKSCSHCSFRENLTWIAYILHAFLLFRIQLLNSYLNSQAAIFLCLQSPASWSIRWPTSADPAFVSYKTITASI